GAGREEQGSGCQAREVMAAHRLPERVRLAEVPALWAQLETELRQAQSAEIDASAMHDFDSGALTLLLSAARLAKERGLSLQVRGMPAKLRELARVYGVEDLLQAT
ncbi:MAG TPA: STAS domain-containing protein, partial [Burkholderiaceae bacterium]